ncbi:MAG: VWA domain-containing protein [Candidatus Rifleibacteriota bacterium]
MFKYPENIIILIAVAIWLTILWRHASKTLLKKRTTFASKLMLTRIAGHKSTRRPVYKWILVILAVLLISIGLMRPQGGMTEEEIFGKGLDLVIALDISKSMKAQDIEGRSRLDVAKAILARMMNGLRDDRIGLVVFAGETMIQSPLSRDKDTFLTFLERVNPSLLAKQGTNLSSAIETSIDRFDINASQTKVIVLFSDGEDRDKERLDRAIDEAGKKNIPIFTVGLGSEKGGYIPEGRTWFGETEYKTYKGERVITKLKDDVLKNIAARTNAEYLRASDISSARDVVSRLNELDRIAVSGGTREIRVELFWLPALIAFLFLLFEWMISERIPYEREKDHWLKRI